MQKLFPLLIVIVSAIGVAAGCGEEPGPSAQETKQSTQEKKEDKSVLEEGADYATGVTPIKEGEKAKETIKSIRETRDQRLEKTLGEEE